VSEIAVGPAAAEGDVLLAVLLNWGKVWVSFLHYVATLDSNSKATWAIRAPKKFVQRHRHHHRRHQDNCETFVKRLGVEVFALFGCSSCGNCVRIVRRRHSRSSFRWDRCRMWVGWGRGKLQSKRETLSSLDAGMAGVI